jgi:hypothetical protein
MRMDPSRLQARRYRPSLPYLLRPHYPLVLSNLMTNAVQVPPEGGDLT